MNDSNILPFPTVEKKAWETLSFFLQPPVQYASSDIAYRLLEVLHSSAFPLAIETTFQSELTSALYYSQQKGIEYFREICRVLPFSRLEEWNNVFLLPQTTLSRIYQEVKELNVFECKILMREIDTRLKYSWQKSFISSYNSLRSIVYNHHQYLLSQIR